jgi:multicomponent Na+:H+ antiporter subunit D
MKIPGITSIPLFAFIIIPLAAALFFFLLRKLATRHLDLLALVPTALMAALALASVPLVAQQRMLVYRLAGWAAPLGIGLAMDGLSVFLLVIVNVLFFLLAMYSGPYLPERGKPLAYTLLMFMLAGLNGVLLSADFFTIYIFMEMTVISAFVLASFYGGAEHFEASFKYAVLGGVSSLFILLAMAFIYAKTGSLGLAGISRGWQVGATPLSVFVMMLLLVGFGLKTTLVPFHAWVPDAYSAAPASISAAYAGAVSKVAGVYLIVRIFFNVLGANPAVLSALSYLGVLSILVGVTLALFQWDFKRLLAYHSISQIGYIILGIGLGTPLGILGGLFHLVNHSVFKPLLFLNAGSVERATGTRNLKELGGLAKKMPVTGATSLIASLSISGVPPLNGFWSKLIIIVACVQAGSYWFALFAALGSILTLSSFLKVQRYAFYGYVKDAYVTVREAPVLMTLPMIILSVCCVFLGILLLPGSDGGILDMATGAVVRGKEYASLLAGLLR